MVKLCPNCGRKLGSFGVNRSNELVYQCGNCLLRSGTILEMTKTAIEKKKRVEATASLFKCKICATSVPSTKINIASIYPDGELEAIHACDTCLPIVDMMEAQRKVTNQEPFITKDKTWDKWLNGFDKHYQYLGQIKDILRKEKKIE